MRALFTGFLTVSISTSIIIGIMLVVRFAFKKAPKALICIMWALVVVRLLLPFQIPVDFSLRPETPVITQSSTGIIEQQQVYVPEELPQFVPVQKVTDNTSAVVIDYMQIATIVWSVGLSAMLGYMLFTYLRLRYALQESVKREEGIYENSALPTAFLLGYLRPRIYLPSDLTGERAELVIRHERAHLHRGDHWLKLMAYVCLAIHWYNPLVWVMYLLLCRDIEGACDEYVIRDLDEQGRSDYSAALLNCGRGKPNFAGCPVAFGEVSIGQRIRNILNYKKPALWICIALVIVMIVSACFLLTDPSKPETPVLHLDAAAREEVLLIELIGKSKADVSATLGFAENDFVKLEQYGSRYKTPITVQYLGMEFSLQCEFLDFDGKLIGVKLVREYAEGTEECARDIVKLAREVVARNGDPKQGPQKGWGAHTIGDYEIPTLYKKIINGPYSKGYIWYFGDKVPESVQQYMKELEAPQFKCSLYWGREFDGGNILLTINWSPSYANPNMNPSYEKTE